MEPRHNGVPRDWQMVFVITGIFVIYIYISEIFSRHFAVIGLGNIVRYIGSLSFKGWLCISSSKSNLFGPPPSNQKQRGHTHCLPKLFLPFFIPLHQCVVGGGLNCTHVTNTTFNSFLNEMLTRLKHRMGLHFV